MSGVNIVIAGVGGQGTLLASRVIGGAAIQSGYDVKVSEVHGMSQRGGSVITFVRYDRTPVCDPLVGLGHADIVLAFETLEAYRCVPYLKPNGRMIVNTQAIDPMPVITGKAAFPSDIIDKLRRYDIRVDAVVASTLAMQAGNSRAVNVVLIGRMAASLDIPQETWLDVLRRNIKPAFLEVNLQAFALGYHPSDAASDDTSQGA